LEAAAVLRGLGADPADATRQWELLNPSPGFDLLITGIGKANAAGSVGRFADVQRHSAILSVGIAGTLESPPPPLGSVILATMSIYADEGLLTPEGFLDCDAMGFPMGPFMGSAIAPGEQLFEKLRPLADNAGPIATVSTCSGVEALARQVCTRTGAIAEAMEGAAVAHIACRLGIPTAELRTISNTTGDRSRQQWDLEGALAKLERVIGALRGLRRSDP
jgi:futalosine hydrolase